MNHKIYLKYGYLMLSVDLKIIPKIEINNTIFYAKNNYHVSLVRLCNYSDSQKKKVLNFTQTVIKDRPINIKEISDTFRLVTEDDRQSIVVRVKMVGLKQLISAINQKFGYKIVYPPTHITLFTLKGQFGIALDTNYRYRLLTRELNNKDNAKLQESFQIIK